ncbi:MAG: nicotinamide riboside transporter PnuC [Gammaproteobacteria bacterium]
MSLIETLAVVLALLYLVLVIKQNVWCWAAAIASTSIYVYVFLSAGLYMESVLQVFYIAMAFYGWWQWRTGSDGQTLAITRWGVKQHALAIAGILVLTVVSGELLNRNTSAALPFVDSLTTWGSIVATYMVTRKVFENWHYWFVIDSVSIYLYLDRGLKQTAMLFAVYLVLIVIGYRAWARELHGLDLPESQG